MSDRTPAPTPEQARTARLRTRRRLLGWSAPVMLLVLLVIVKLLSVPMITNAAADAFDDGDFSGSAAGFHKLRTVNVAEQWKVHYNEGTALLAGGDTDAAITALETAYDLAPEVPEDLGSTPVEDLPRCIVQRNLSVATELKGDEVQLVGDGQVTTMKEEQKELDALGPDGPTDGSAAPDPEASRSAAIQSYLDAEALYRDANEIRIRNGCEDLDEARDRNVEKETTAREKREALENPPEPPPPPEQQPTDPPEDPPEQPTDPEEEQRQKDLEERQKGGQQEKNFDELFDSPDGERDYDVPQW